MHLFFTPVPVCQHFVILNSRWVLAVNILPWFITAWAGHPCVGNLQSSRLPCLPPTPTPHPPKSIPTDRKRQRRTMRNAEKGLSLLTLDSKMCLAALGSIDCADMEHKLLYYPCSQPVASTAQVLKKTIRTMIYGVGLELPNHVHMQSKCRCTTFWHSNVCNRNAVHVLNRLKMAT